MSLVIDQIKDELGVFAGLRGPSVIMMANVTGVNEDDTVSVTFADGSTVDDVRMKAVVKDGNKFLLIPKVGSNILIGKINNEDEYVVIAVDEITEVKYIIDNLTYSVNADGFMLQKSTDNLKDSLVTFIEAVEVIVVMEGTNPNYAKLAEAKLKIQNLLR